ncbi:ABC transporter substrate-binding protein [Tepidibacter formicigenes]|uniref:Raffinose/stachyose/melibiose transport system substrate-binding protein n=1 Tax=Tepidibacter formicigenes DSM 15518 TaxID=1123349 RepID=A0A1M6K402_9FIRM|nr:ABC transporter substrate-binding protein [Tepidibacter formicigenes]SHJ53635.1 raffinose/stachyose/melibiose transport system substrate-binding protein [Tepidibacter formicigenes DSM 15518]
MKIKKKLFSVLTCILALMVSLTACGSSSQESADSGNKVNVDVFQFKVEAKDALEKAAGIYMEKNPNVKINIQTVGGGDDYGAALKSKFASGEEPAIFNIGGPQDMIDWKEKLEDLSSESWVNEAYNGVLDAVTEDGKVYGMPFNQEGYGFIYNKEIFKKAGINPESIKSFTDLENAVKTLDSKKEELGLKSVIAFPGKETWVTGLHLSNVAFSNEFSSATDAFNAKNIEFKYANALKKLVDLQADYGYKPDGTKASLNSVDYSTQVEELFALGQVALIQQGNWAYGSVAGIDEELAANIGMLPMPLEGVKEDSIPVGVPMYWAINTTKDDEVKTVAKDFLNWLYTSDEGKDLIINEFKFIPAFKGYEGDNLQPKDTLAKEIIRYSNEGKTMPWVFMGYPTGWGMDKLGADIQKYLSEEMTWEELVKNAKATWTDARK